MEDIRQEDNFHFVHSTLRERVVEHVFVGAVLKRLWQRGVTDVEVLRSEFDAGGYDLVLSLRKVVRHIQFKTVLVDGKAASTKVSLKLLEKSSGCIIWIVVERNLEFESYLWYGGSPGQPLPDIRQMKVAKHTKSNVSGTKMERPNHRIIPRSRFKEVGSLDDLLYLVFGELA